MELTKQQFDVAMAKYPNLSSLGLQYPTVLSCRNSSEEFVLKDIILRGHQSYWENFLVRTDSCIGKVIQKFKSKKIIRAKLNSSPFSTLWELEFAAHCEEKGISFTPEHKTIGNSNVDFCILLAGKPVLVEAYVRRLELPEGPAFADITRKIDEVVKEKIFGNGIGCATSEQILVAIDGHYSGLDTINVSAALEQYGNQSPHVSAVFLKHFGMYLIPNRHANQPLSDEQCKELTK